MGILLFLLGSFPFAEAHPCAGQDSQNEEDMCMTEISENVSQNGTSMNTYAFGFLITMILMILALIYGLVLLWREVQRLRLTLQQQETQLLEPLVTRLTTSEQEIQDVRNTYRNRCQYIDEEQDSLRNSIEDLEEELKELRRRAERPHSEEPPRSRRRREHSEDSARDEPEPDGETDIRRFRRRFDETASRSRDDSDREEQDSQEEDEEGVPDTYATADDATVGQYIHDLELARRHEEHIRRRSGELMYESNNLEVAISQLMQQEPYASGQPIEDVVIERLYAQHAPHMPLPGQSDIAEQFWTDYGLYGQPRYNFLETGAPEPQMTYIFDSQTGLHGFRTARIHIRYRNEGMPGPWPTEQTIANLYRHFCRMWNADVVQLTDSDTGADLTFGAYQVHLLAQGLKELPFSIMYIDIIDYIILNILIVLNILNISEYFEYRRCHRMDLNDMNGDEWYEWGQFASQYSEFCQWVYPSIRHILLTFFVCDARFSEGFAAGFDGFVHGRRQLRDLSDLLALMSHANAANMDKLW